MITYHDEQPELDLGETIHHGVIQKNLQEENAERIRQALVTLNLQFAHDIRKIIESAGNEAAAIQLSGKASLQFVRRTNEILESKS